MSASCCNEDAIAKRTNGWGGGEEKPVLQEGRKNPMEMLISAWRAFG